MRGILSRRPGGAVILLALLALLSSATACGGSAEAPRNVILIGVDTLRADRLGLYGAERPTSPFLDRLSEEAAVFDRAFATSPWTLPSFASMLTGRLQSGHAAGIPLRNSDVDWEAERVGPQRLVMLDPGVPTLAERLRDRGMMTAAIVQNPFLAPAFGIDRGFVEYDYYRGDHRDTRRADVVVDRALERLEAIDGEPFFLFVHLFDPHMQYDAPAPYGGMFTDGIAPGMELPVTGDPRRMNREAGEMPAERRRFIAAAYDEEIRFVDSQLERLVAGLRERGLWEESLVILTSDHGEELFDHGGFEHGHTLYDELLRVPLIVWGPGIRAGRTDAVASVADVAPTTLEALGAEPPEGSFGISLWSHLRRGTELPGRLIAAEGTLYGPELKAGIEWPHKVVLNTKSGAVRLFDLESDPAETGQIGTAPELQRGLVERLVSLLASAARGVTLQETEMDPGLRDRLRALGYIE